MNADSIRSHKQGIVHTSEKMGLREPRSNRILLNISVASFQVKIYAALLICPRQYFSHDITKVVYIHLNCLIYCCLTICWKGLFARLSSLGIKYLLIFLVPPSQHDSAEIKTNLCTIQGTKQHHCSKCFMLINLINYNNKISLRLKQ